MEKTELEKEYDLLKEKFNRHEQILVQAYHSLKRKEEELKVLNENLADTLRQLNETQAQLIQTEKMASLGVLTAGIAHEINNPLNFIRGSYQGLKILLEDSNNDGGKDVEKLLAYIDEGVSRAEKIVHGLSEFSRNKLTWSEECKLHEILDDCQRMLGFELDQGISIHTDYSNQILCTKGNCGELSQAFLNIIQNGIQAIDQQGSVHLSTKTDGSFHEITIKDTGVGINKENLPRVMDPFFTTKNPGMGTGLGMFITYKIIIQHKGSIEIESESGEGTKVIVKLPAFV